MGKRIFSIFIVAVMLMTSCIVTSAGEYAEGDGQWEPDWAYSEEGNEWWSEVVENIETWNENSWYDTTSDEEIYPDYPENTYVDPENIPFSEDDWYTQNDDITPMENSIIEINGVGYANMADAVANSQNNDVLKLTADIFLANPVHIAWTWDGKLYLDLNGHDIRLYGAEENSADQDNSGALYDEGMGGMIILENGTLEVIDTS